MTNPPPLWDFPFCFAHSRVPPVKRFLFSGFSLLLSTFVLLVSSAPTSSAQSDIWDDLLLDSHWYVPSANLLAYITSGTDLTQTLPVADQTLWSITTATNGVFSGSSVATFKIGSQTSDPTTTAINGVITDSGQIRITFTGGSAPIIGIGQVRVEGTETYIEMQMITGSGGEDGTYTTHWAYMASYDGTPSILPPLEIDPLLIDLEWAWIQGTSWNLSSPGLFDGGDALFTIDSYHNGYFWGSGTAETGDFTLLGSATPEGNVLFNILSGGVLTSLSGQITGDSATGTMALRSYDSQSGFGDAAQAQVVPEPGALTLLVLAALFLLLHRRPPARS